MLKKLPKAFRSDQEKAFDRMRDEYRNYEFRQAGTAERRWYDCWNRKTEEQYEVTSFTCSCWSGLRLNKVGSVCKHSLGLMVALGRGEVLPEHTPWGNIGKNAKGETR